MILVLQREILSDESTIGRIHIGGEQVCFSLEDVLRPDGIKVPGKTAIPAGRYKLDITHSNRFGKRLPILGKVPNFEGVRIHAGNTHADTEGCILVGLTKDKNFIGKSQMAMSLLQPRIQDALDRGEEVWIEIRNP